MMDDLPLDRALTALGELLAADGETVRLVAVGGAALRLRGLVERTTTDVDVIARVDEAGGAVVPPDPLPASATACSLATASMSVSSPSRSTTRLAGALDGVAVPAKSTSASTITRSMAA